ncbi:MAG TPA: MATE family efflux transporter, partial [Phnomibacter sp.]|nr:MATE family efflux transporter [Phnomibacter sp.]
MRGVLQLLRQALSSHQMDYTAMPVRRAIVLLAVPMILELCMESVFALVDIFFVNRWLGNHAVTAIGLTESVLSLVYAMAIGISMAATAMVARRTGEKDAEGAATAAAQALMLGLGVSVIIA